MLVSNLDIFLECTRTILNDSDYISLRWHCMLFFTNLGESGWVTETWTYKFGADCRSALYRVVSETNVRCSRVGHKFYDIFDFSRFLIVASVMLR